MNSFVLNIVGIGITLADLDMFQASVILPTTSQKLPKKFFQDRVQQPKKESKHPHTKCFASECLLAVSVLALFCQIVLDPLGKLQQHSHAWKLLKSILDILQLGDRAVQKSTELSLLVEQHHRQLLHTYPREILKPKIHLCYHVPEALARVGANLNCFATERRNQAYKAVMGNAKGKHPDAPLLNRILFDVIECADDSSRLQEFELLKPLVEAPSVVPELRSQGFDCDKAVASRAMRTRLGKNSLDDIIVVKKPCGGKFIGRVLFFAAIKHYVRGVGASCFVALELLHDADGVWVPSALQELLHASCLESCVPFVRRLGGIVPILPASF
eukprot:3892248-Pyramimonas_sp.AAC.1